MLKRFAIAMVVAFAWMIQSMPLALGTQSDGVLPPPKAKGALRIATFNVSLNRKESGELISDLKKDDAQAKRIAIIVQTVRPDVFLANELDHDSEQLAALLFRDEYLNKFPGLNKSVPPVRYEHFFSAEVNTGVPSGLDLNRNGKSNEPDDAWGFGAFPGQYGMVVYSRFPFDKRKVRTFQKLKWSKVPNASRPKLGNGKFFYPDDVWEKLFLSSKSHWDIPFQIDGEILHLLASHPTPPVFDGEEDRNGCRNHDEIRFWVDYVEGKEASYIVDDAGGAGPLDSKASFVVLGDLNSDPIDGAGQASAIRNLLDSARVAKGDAPKSLGAVEASERQGDANKKHKGPSENDTADFNDKSSGNLRCDFVLPSQDFEILASGVYWPTQAQLKEIDPKLMDASDHRMVWVDIRKRSAETVPAK